MSFRKRAESLVAASFVDVVIPKHARQSAATDQAVQSPTAKDSSRALGREVPGEKNTGEVKEQLHEAGKRRDRHPAPCGLGESGTLGFFVFGCQ